MKNRKPNEDAACSLDQPTIQAQAEYRPQPLAEYRGNPLIEALPDIFSSKEAMRRMCRLPQFDPAERTLGAHLRFHCVRRLKHLLLPLPESAALERTVGEMLRQGYVHRNPTDPRATEHLYRVCGQRFLDLPADTLDTPAACLFLTGFSGMGKSTAINQVLSLYPPVITHHSYEGTTCSMTQIVWLRVQCPKDGSLRGLCSEFFTAVDRTVGTRYYEKYSRGRKSIHDLEIGMQGVASTFRLGLLVVDEIQNLNLAKTGGAARMLAFFRGLTNQIGVPMVIVGTYAATNLFAGHLQEVRRATDEGLIDLWRPTPNDPNWQRFVEELWKYQWVKDPVELTDTIRAALYDVSQGITDLVVRILILAQRMAIGTRRDTVDEARIRAASRQHFALLEPALAALRSNDPRKLMQFDDLLPPRKKLDWVLKKSDPPRLSAEKEQATIEPADSEEAEQVVDATTDRKRVSQTRSELPKPAEGGLLAAEGQTNPHAFLKKEGLVQDLARLLHIQEGTGSAAPP